MPKVANSNVEETEDLVVVGSGGVGKSCLTVRFLKDEFLSEYDPTIEENYRKNISVDSKPCVVNIIDTAGQHEYTSLRDQHLKAGKGFLLVFSVTDAGSFDELKQLREQIIKLKDTKRVPIVVCGNKADIPAEQWEVSQETVLNFVTPLKIPYKLTSAKENMNVNDAFHDLVRECRRVSSAKTKDSNAKLKDSGISLNSVAKKEKSGGKCAIL